MDAVKKKQYPIHKTHFDSLFDLLGFAHRGRRPAYKTLFTHMRWMPSKAPATQNYGCHEKNAVSQARNALRQSLRSPHAAALGARVGARHAQLLARPLEHTHALQSVEQIHGK